MLLSPLSVKCQEKKDIFFKISLRSHITFLVFWTFTLSLLVFFCPFVLVPKAHVQLYKATFHSSWYCYQRSYWIGVWLGFFFLLVFVRYLVNRMSNLLFKEVIAIQFEYRHIIVQFSFLPVIIPVKEYLSPLYCLCLQKICMICVNIPRY